MRLKNGGDSGNAQPPGGMPAPPLMPSPSPNLHEKLNETNQRGSKHKFTGAGILVASCFFSELYADHEKVPGEMTGCAVVGFASQSTSRLPTCLGQDPFVA
jgi:hypothetical protein